MRTSMLVTLLALVCPRVASASTVEGTVFLDEDGDGVFSAPDVPVAGATVAWEHAVFTTADAGGRFHLDVPNGVGGIVWVSVPAEGRPGPVWAVIPAGGAPDADLAITPLAPPVGPWTFVVAADSHMDGVSGLWTPADLAAALDQALDGATPPRFYTIVGDITQANRPEDFDAFADAVAGVETPWVPVPGNHDWYDGGVAYRAHFGPDNYSFTTGGVHFIVWNSALSASEVNAFIARDLETVDPMMRVVALGHVPPSDAVAGAMREAGVDVLFSGHWHANLAMDRDGMLELGTEPFVMGGIDLSPAGYRVITVDDGDLSSERHTFVDQPVLHVDWPPDDRCADGDVLVSAEVGAGLVAVEVAIDGESQHAEHLGGWLWRAPVNGVATGTHDVRVSASDALGTVATTDARFTVCDTTTSAPLQLGDWPQVQGDPQHVGATTDAPSLPLASAWIAAVGGHLAIGSPVVLDGRAFVSVNDDPIGALVALDAQDGHVEWRVSTPRPLRNSPAVADGIVVVAESDGVVDAFETATGAPRWRVDLGAGVDAMQSALWAAPTIRDGTVYIGIQRRLAAIDLATGAIVWSVDPVPSGVWLGSFSAVAVTPDLVLGAFNRTSGVTAWNRLDGAPLWTWKADVATAINASIVVVDRTAYVGTVQGDLVALDTDDGTQRWSTRVIDGGHDWAYGIVGTPAYADGRLFVATQWDHFVALDAATGDELWTYDARVGTVRAAHYRGVQAGFQGSPVVTGDLVWVADTSGLLVALDVATGDVRWSTDLGVPALGGIAVAGDLVLVSTWDGVVHAFAPQTAVPTPAPSGCCSSTSDPGSGSWLLVLFVIRRRVRAGRA